MSFATEFPVSSKCRSSDFLASIREWILGSPHTQFHEGELKGLGDQDRWSTHNSIERLEVLRFSLNYDESVAIRYTKSQRGLAWITTAVFSRDQDSSWVGIRTYCESQRPTTRLPVTKKPVLVRVLLNNLGGDYDGSLLVGKSPLFLDNIDIDIAARCISGSTGSRLPIVYVSSSFQGGHLVNVEPLAKNLAGMAHVVVEPNRPFSLRLMTEVNAQNVYGGAVGVYWPDRGGRRSFFVGPEFGSPDEIAQSVIEEVQNALANRRSQPRCTWASLQEAQSRKALETLRAQGETEVDRYIDEFGKELQATKERLSEAEKEIEHLGAEIRTYRTRDPRQAGFVLRTGQEQDLYQGEVFGVVRESVEAALKVARKDSRREHILTSIAAANPPSDAPDSRRSRIKALLRDFRSMDAKTKRGLQDLGFEISADGKHYKLTFQGDDRYTYTLPKSGGDRRGGLNAASDISGLMF